MGNLALETSGKVLGDKLKSEAKDRIMKQIMCDAIGEGTNEVFKKSLGWTTLFFTFIETYAKAVKAANLERVKRDYEVCPHIGQCQNMSHAITIASKTTATVWYVEGFYYFHPQINYKVRRSTQIFRSTSDGRWKTENPRNPEFLLEDCWACVEAHGQRN